MNKFGKTAEGGRLTDKGKAILKAPRYPATTATSHKAKLFPDMFQ